MGGLFMSPKQYLTIMQMNDIHGYYNLHPELFTEKGRSIFRNAGGYSRIATLLKETRKENPDGILTLDNGDTFHGTYPVVSSKGEVLLPVLNALQIDAMTAHWDFAYGPEQLKYLTDQLNYPMIACNIFNKKTDSPVFDSHIIKERAGLKIGIVGIAEHIVDKMMPDHFSEGIYFTLGVNEVQRTIKNLKENNQMDLVVVLSHFGFPQDVKLAEETEGIDIILSGHTHNSLSRPADINGTLIIQSGCHGAHIGKLDLEIEDKKIVDFSHQLIEVAEHVEMDGEVQGMIDKAVEPYMESMREIIGYTATDLHRYNQLETTTDNLLLQSLLDVTNAEIAFSNGWRYGAPIPAGPITLNDVWNIIPTNPPVSTVYLSGREILDMLEENIENTFSSDPYKQMGGYLKRCLGMKMYIKIENPKGLRIQDVYIREEPLDESKYYRAAFVTIQGVPKKYGERRQNLDISAVEALTEYIKKTGTVSSDLLGTIQIV